MGCDEKYVIKNDRQYALKKLFAFVGMEEKNTYPWITAALVTVNFLIILWLWTPLFNMQVGNFEFDENTLEEVFCLINESTLSSETSGNMEVQIEKWPSFFGNVVPQHSFGFYKYMFVGVLFSILEGVIQIISLSYLSKLVNGNVQGTDFTGKGGQLENALIYIGFIAMKGLCMFTEKAMFGRGLVLYSFELRTKIFNSYLNSTLQELEETDTAKMRRCITEECELVTRPGLQEITNSFTPLTEVISGLVLVFMINVKLSIMLLFLVSVTLVWNRIQFKLLQTYTVKYNAVQDELGSYTGEIIDFLETVFLFRRQEDEKKKSMEVIRKHVNIGNMMALISTFCTSMQIHVMMATACVGMAYAGYVESIGGLKPGQLTVYAFASFVCFSSSTIFIYFYNAKYMLT